MEEFTFARERQAASGSTEQTRTKLGLQLLNAATDGGTTDPQTLIPCMRASGKND